VHQNSYDVTARADGTWAWRVLDAQGRLAVQSTAAGEAEAHAAARGAMRSLDVLSRNNRFARSPSLTLA
jgi:hypothetical protein